MADFGKNALQDAASIMSNWQMSSYQQFSALITVLEQWSPTTGGNVANLATDANLDAIHGAGAATWKALRDTLNTNLGGVIDQLKVYRDKLKPE